MIRIRMLKLAGRYLCKPFSIIFKSSLSLMEIPMEWKNANVVLIHKKRINSALKTTDLSLCF